MKNILVIDDEINICILLNKILASPEVTVDTTLSGNTAVKMLKGKPYDLVFCDYRLKDKERDGASLLTEIHQISPLTTVVMMTGYPDVRVAIKMIRDGAYEYLEKPFHPDLIRALATRILSNEAVPAPAEKIPEKTTYVYGESHASTKLYGHIALVAPTEYSLVISGETGVGKEAVARLAHLHSRRRSHPFIALDCGCLSEELAASELFVHEKGAFTGAINTVQGAFEQAKGGTLFLDEITNLNYQVQTALLRATQERVVRPVGGLREIAVDVRIIAASNENLQKAVADGRFRSDLFYRLNEFTITVPPLRERLQDLPLLIEAFLEGSRRFSDTAMECLYKYAWPGNIRELKNVVRRACLLETNEQELTTASLPPEIIGLPEEKMPAPPHVSGDKDHLRSVAMQAEYNKIMSVMKAARYNKTKAARMLNVDRKTLYNKLHLFHIAL
jgi:two-component system response regulator HydG